MVSDERNINFFLDKISHIKVLAEATLKEKNKRAEIEKWANHTCEPHDLRCLILKLKNLRDLSKT